MNTIYFKFFTVNNQYLISFIELNSQVNINFIERSFGNNVPQITECSE